MQHDVRKTHAPRWGEWLGRVVSQVIRISGLLHAFRHGPQFVDKEICVEDVERAIRMIEFYMKEAERILNGVTRNKTAEIADLVKTYIALTIHPIAARAFCGHP